ncbi:prospero homeobox protein 1-like isoform X2 [Polyodon spathula]|uniref:prospero homeobox protein 1-like isoform X2 n=1 Tax=Polyodon spathula TaxID=7913 RepID=UPI001B7DEBDB|nr:prospero homeobox protein 1-like isoform X2 [Polyodon spathula]
MDCTKDQAGGETSHAFPYRLYSTPKKGRPYEEAPPYPLPAGSLISHLLKTTSSTSLPQESGAAEPYQDSEGEASLGDSPPSSPPGKRRSLDMENLYQEYVRAKRARVESIIRGMGSSPAQELYTGGNGARRSEVGWPDRAEPILEPPRPKIKKEGRNQERQELKSQLDSMREQLLQLQEKVYHMYSGALEEEEVEEEEEEEEEEAEAAGPQRGSPLSPQAVSFEGTRLKDLLADIGKDQPWANLEGQKLADALKEELGAAVAQVIDGVVRMFAPPGQDPGNPQEPLIPAFQPPPQNHPHHHHLLQQNEHPDQGPFFDNEARGRDFMADQVEALPLVVRKSMDHQGSSPIPRVKESTLRSAFQPPIPMPLVHYTMQRMFASAARGVPPCKDRLSPDAYLEMTSLSTQLSSHHHHHPPQHHYPSLHLLGTLEGMSPAMHPKMKPDTSGYQDPGDPSLYLSQSADGLSPSHLKKAKLMFFYSRYPSSNTLKIFFPDVKFNRCITSQLIKWFSNFREFFYIQMEKFARQAYGEGVSSHEKLSISRDSELFRVLNLHYNKSNDFEVPERFLEVSQITLREFFTAIHSGKDTDPSWKKAIYKVICKLDSEVPELFKSPGCLQELIRE